MVLDYINFVYKDLEKQNFPKSTLYVLGMPIGNFGDITVRGIKILLLADQIACEDTRKTGIYLSRLGVKKKLKSVHKFNERKVVSEIMSELKIGKRIVLVSDAGTPGIADPGVKIVDSVIDAGYKVIPIPGVSAATAAISVSGLFSDRFLFLGFLPSKILHRDKTLKEASSLETTIIFFESPHRIIGTLKSLDNFFESDQRIVISREISKKFEEIYRNKVSEISKWINEDSYRQKGEFVIIIEANLKAEKKDRFEIKNLIQILLEECSVKQATSIASKLTGKKKKEIYNIALNLQQNK